MMHEIVQSDISAKCSCGWTYRDPLGYRLNSKTDAHMDENRPSSLRYADSKIDYVLDEDDQEDPICGVKKDQLIEIHFNIGEVLVIRVHSVITDVNENVTSIVGNKAGTSNLVEIPWTSIMYIQFLMKENDNG